MAFIKTRKKIVSSAIASSLSIMAGTAIAQDQVTQLETIQTQAEAEQSFKVDQSANKKFVAPLLDTAKSVSVISKQLIQDTQVTTLADALRTVPGITLGAGEGGNPNGDRPFIRGYNSESSMYVDGVRSATSQNREMFAVEQVEVTKGSASAMGGAGTSGGSINMVSKLAKKGDSLEGSVAAGTDSYARITLDGNKDFGNGIAARVAIMGHQNEKAGQHDGAEYKRVGIAPSITFGLDTATRATLSYYYLKSDDLPDSGIPYGNPFNAKLSNGSANPRYPENGNGKPIDVKQGTYYGWRDRDFMKQENQIGTLKLEHDITPDITISNTAVFSNSKNDYIYTQPDDSKGNFITNGKVDGTVWRRANSRVTDTDAFTDQLSLAGKFDTGILTHRFNAGAEYTRQESDKGSYSVSALANGNCTGYTSGTCTPAHNPNAKDPWTGTITFGGYGTTTTAETTSLYALDNIEITPKWLLDLGIRWDQFDSEVKYNQDSGKPADTTYVAAGTKFKTDNDFFNYQIGLTYKPAENGSIYASFATSANPVGVDAGDGSESISTVGRGTDATQATVTNNLKPEEVQTWEIGTKWDLFNQKLNLTAAIFRTEKTNTRATDINGFTNNIGETRVDGFELGINGKITNKWGISAGYTYLDSEIVNDGVGTNDGNKVQNVAQNSGTLWTTYQILPKLNLGVGAIAMDKVYGNADNTKYVPGYVRYDAMARYDVNKQVNVQLNYNNISNERYFTKAYASHYATEAEGTNAVLAINFKY